MSKAERRVPERLADNTLRTLRWAGQLRLAVERLPPDGYIGDPTAATAELGARSCSRAPCSRSARRCARSPPSTSGGDDDGRSTHDWHDLRDRRRPAVARLEALGEIGAVHGPNGERGCARLALTDADRDGRDLVVVVDARPRPGGRDRRDRQRRRHPRRHRSRGGGGDDRLAHRHGAHRRPLRRQPRRARRARGRRDARAARHRRHGARSGRVLHRRGRRPLRARHARQPRLRRRAGARGGARRARRRRRCPARRRAGPHRLRRSDPCPTAASRTPTSSCTSSRVRSWRTRASTIGVVTGVQGISWTELTITGQSAHAGTTPMRLRHDPVVVAARDHHERAR